ncbi:MAG: hypothetical protein V4718_12145, partial [Pseudomonadota bacterium]
RLQIVAMQQNVGRLAWTINSDFAHSLFHHCNNGALNLANNRFQPQNSAICCHGGPFKRERQNG